MKGDIPAPAMRLLNSGKVEIEPKYFEIACARIENEQRQERMFA